MYSIGEKVYYLGSSYICHTIPLIGTLPTNTEYWSIISQKGDTGDQGPQGVQGIPGGEWTDADLLPFTDENGDFPSALVGPALVHAGSKFAENDLNLGDKSLKQLANFALMYNGINPASIVHVDANTVEITTNTTYGAAGLAVPYVNGHKYHVHTKITNLNASSINGVYLMVGYNNSPTSDGVVFANGIALCGACTLGPGSTKEYEFEITANNASYTAICAQAMASSNPANIRIEQYVYETTDLDSVFNSLLIDWSGLGNRPLMAQLAKNVMPGNLTPDAFSSDLKKKFKYQLANQNYMYNGGDRPIVVDAQTLEFISSTTWGHVGLCVSNTKDHIYKAVSIVTNIGGSSASVKPMVGYSNGIDAGVGMNGQIFNNVSIVAGGAYTFVTEFTSTSDAYLKVALGIFTSTNGASLRVQQAIYDVTDLTTSQRTAIKSFSTELYIFFADSTAHVESPWSGKTWTVLGDSIMASNNIQPIVKADLGISTLNNLGVAGQAVRTMADNLTSEIAAASDLITLYGCLNDFYPGAAPIGSLSDAANKDGSTFLSKLKYTIETVLTLAPTKMFVIIGTHNACDTYRPAIYQPVNGTDDIGNYVKAMGEMARRYGLPFIDMYGKSGFNALSLSTYTGDNAHPNSAGAAVIARIMSGELKKLNPLQ